MIEGILLSPPVVGMLFLALIYGLYRAGGALMASGEDFPGKYRPYACGEDLQLPPTQLAYQTFFQLGLMFALLHLATLIVSTLPVDATSHRVAAVYLLGIGISVLVLTKEEA